MADLTVSPDIDAFMAAADDAAARTALGAIGGSTGATDALVLVADGTGGATLKAGTGLAWSSGSGGTLTLPIVKPTYIRCGEPGYNPWDINAFYTRFASDVDIVWANTTNAVTGTSDTGIGRVAAAVVGPTDGSTGGAVFELLQVAALGTVSSNSARLGTLDVAGTAELFGKNEAGTEVQLTAHPQDAPEWMYDETPGLERFDKTIQNYLGTINWVNQDRVARLSEMTDAEKSALPAEKRKTIFRETFAEYNARLGLDEDKAKTVRDWDEDQDTKAQERVIQQAAWDAEKDEAEAKLAEYEKLAEEEKAKAQPPVLPDPEKRPPDFTPKPKPEFLRAAEVVAGPTPVKDGV